MRLPEITAVTRIAQIAEPILTGIDSPKKLPPSGNNQAVWRIYTNVTMRGESVGASGLKRQANPDGF